MSASGVTSRARADIQALRAIAVMLVVVNHLWPSRLGGGYVGVDVFFVISGYLITMHLLREIERTDRVSLPRFYARRARRLLPAALLVSTLSLLAGLLLLPPERWQRVAQEILAATAYVENWLLSASSVDYWAKDQFATPVQHYWSLSVEEQFYLLWPVTLLLLGWLFARRRTGRISSRRGALVAGIAAIGGASLMLALWQTAVGRDAAYFNTFGRVWEFMLGGLIAALAPAIAARYASRGGDGPLRLFRGCAQLLGYAAIFWAALSFDDQTPFPGPWALLPAIGTALVIAAGPEMPRWSPARGLEWRPIQYLGDISYSLYLWHWPLIVFAPFVLGRTTSTLDRLLLLVLGVLLAALTKHFVEDPGRKRLFAGARPRRTLMAALASVAVMAGLTFGTGAWADHLELQRAAAIEQARASACFGADSLASDCDDPFGPTLFPAGGKSESPWAARNAPECSEAASEEQILSGGKPSMIRCDFASSGGQDASRPLDVWLVGDSHAEHWQAAVIDLARGNSWRLTRVAYGGCPTVPVPVVHFDDHRVTPEKRASCLDWSTQLNERIKKERPDLVLVSNFAAAETLDDGTGRPQADQLEDGIRRSLLKWARRGTDVVVIRDTPIGGEKIGADCSAGPRGGKERGCVAPRSDVLPADPMAQAVKRLDRPRLSTISMTRYFCDDEFCSGVVGGVPVYYDTDHMAASYSRSLAPMLGKKLSAKLGLDLEGPADPPD